MSDKTCIDYEPGTTDLTKHEGKLVARLTFKQLTFLDAYADCMDMNEAVRRSNVSKPSLQNWLKQPEFQNELNEIYEAFRKARKLTATNAAVNHLELVEKLNRDYDESDLELRAKFANPLVKASDTWLKATSDKDDRSGSNVTINIDLGADDKVTITNE